jgi:hypothetical protein
MTNLQRNKKTAKTNKNENNFVTAFKKSYGF